VGSDRKADLAHVEAQLKELGDEMRQIQKTYQTYHSEVQDTVKDIMVEAGVFEQVNKLEQERAEAGERAQKKIQALQQKAQDLQRIRAFLVGREQIDQAEEKSEAEPSDETDAGDSPDDAEKWEDPTEESGDEADSKGPKPPSF
jgi:hypothetical protein